MAVSSDPNPSKKVFTAGPYSWMNFMREELIYDMERKSLVRFRGMFNMPKWDGVEDNEVDYVVDGPTLRLDKLAAMYWGSDRQSMWWVIAARNGLDLPNVQLYKGRRLKIPTREWVDSNLLTQAAVLVGKEK